MNRTRGSSMISMGLLYHNPSRCAGGTWPCPLLTADGQAVEGVAHASLLQGATMRVGEGGEAVHLTDVEGLAATAGGEGAQALVAVAEGFVGGPQGWEGHEAVAAGVDVGQGRTA